MADMPTGRQRFVWVPRGAKSPDPGPPPRPVNKAFSPFGRLESIRRAPPASTTVTVGHRTYREVDNGRANVLVPAGDPYFTPAERAAQRDGLARALFQAGHPVGAIVSGAARTAGASPEVQDAMLQAGGLVDDMAQGATARGRTVRSRSPTPERQGPPLKRDRIWFGGDTVDQPATYVGGTAAEGLLGGGTKPDRKIKPPGWRGNGKVFNEARGHLSAAQLGGSGDDPRNLVTLTQNKTNSSHMKRFENAIARRARRGEVVEYLTMPLYTPGMLAPSAILMTAYGSRTGPTARYIHNPAGRRR